MVLTNHWAARAHGLQQKSLSCEGRVSEISLGTSSLAFLAGEWLLDTSQKMDKICTHGHPQVDRIYIEYMEIIFKKNDIGISSKKKTYSFFRMIFYAYLHVCVNVGL